MLKQNQTASKKRNSNGSHSATHRKFKDHLLSPTSKLMKEWDNIGDDNSEKKAGNNWNMSMEKGPKKNLKPIFKNSQGNIDSQTGSKEVLNQEQNNFKKLEYSSQFQQRRQIKRITNILLQSQQESLPIKLLNQPLMRRNKKSLTNLEKNNGMTIKINVVPNDPAVGSDKCVNNVISEKAGNNINNVERLNISHQKNTIFVSNEQAEKPMEKQIEKKNTNIKQISYDDFLGSSTDLEQLFFRKTVNLGNKKIDEFYEVLEENPTFNTHETQNVPQKGLIIDSKKLSTLSISNKFRTITGDFENMAQSDFSLAPILLKFSKIWLSFPWNQNIETLEEYYEEIFQENILFSKGNIFFYSVFNLLVCLLWILIHNDIYGFNGFFSTRIVILSLALTFAKFWTKDFMKKYHKGFILCYYGFTAIQILVFTIINPQIEIVMEIEFLACYLSLTRYAFISFINSLLISLIYLILHIVYLNIVTNPSFLMLHSTFLVIFFNLVGVHIQVKTQIDNFNKIRINVIKKKQLNNMIVNLLPNHVLYKINFLFS